MSARPIKRKRNMQDTPMSYYRAHAKRIAALERRLDSALKQIATAFGGSLSTLAMKTRKMPSGSYKNGWLTMTKGSK